METTEIDHVVVESKKIDHTGSRRLSVDQEIEKLLRRRGQESYMQIITRKEFEALSIHAPNNRASKFPINQLDYTRFRDHFPRRTA